MTNRKSICTKIGDLNGVMALIMAALHSRCGHYIFVQYFVLLLSFSTHGVA